MSEYKQPWRPLKLDGRRARLQILDPETAFDWEPRLVGLLGEHLSLAVASPADILGTVLVRSSAGGLAAGLDFRRILSDPEHGPTMAAQAIGSLGTLVADVLSNLQVSPELARRAFKAFVLGRLRVDGVEIEDAEDWQAAKLRPLAKWAALSAQIRQTFGPLWLRKPYQVRSEVNTYGVPEPSSVPLAVRWADNLARNDSASSSHEILTTWTPLRMIEVVENTAYQNEIDKRAHAAARAKK